MTNFLELSLGNVGKRKAPLDEYCSINNYKNGYLFIPQTHKYVKGYKLSHGFGLEKTWNFGQLVLFYRISLTRKVAKNW